MTGDKANGLRLASIRPKLKKRWTGYLIATSNGNGLVEMMTDNISEKKKSSDWIDIIWASYENAFVNAKLYHAPGVKWANIERQLNNTAKANYYQNFCSEG